MSPDLILDFLKNLPIQDYIFVVLILVFTIFFFFAGVKTLYKAIFGTGIGFIFFSFVNMSVSMANKREDEPFTSMTTYILENKHDLLVLSFYLIPVFAILTVFNSDLEFLDSSKKSILRKIRVLILSPFFLLYFLSLYLTIIQNKFVFGLDGEIVKYVTEKPFLVSFLGLVEESKLFGFLLKYDYLISLFGFLFIFYILTIGGIIHNFIEYIRYKIRKSRLEKASSKENELPEGLENLPIDSNIDLNALKM